MKRYLKIWWLLTVRTSQVAFYSRFGAFIFIFGKILRFAFFLLFLILLESKTKVIGGFTLPQIIFFFATFNLIDTLGQFFLREVYRFRSYVISGYFDYILTKPISSLFRSLLGGSDVLDLFLLFISLLFIIFTFGKIAPASIFNIILYISFIFNGLLIALSFHTFVLSIGILTTEVDNTIMLYRDLTQMGRIPIDLYKEPVRGFLTFIIPVGVMMTFPAKAIMGFLSFTLISASFLIGISLFFLSIYFWRYSLRYYSSASS
ncbi:MAG: ABC-2 family transporter protein [bacterium]|nr:ABC-2 family transporter protein [bacterium]